MRIPSTLITSRRSTGMIERVKYPWAMGPPNGPFLARSTSVWIH